MYAVAIDGPAGSGKSTIAKIIAKELDISYVDTGAMYRAIAFKVRKENLKTEQEIEKALKNVDIDFINSRIFLDGEDISDKIRTEEMSIAASNISKLSFVREKLVSIQQDIASRKPVVMEGRDIGTVVLTKADYKFYLTAGVDARAMRRYKQNQKLGISSNLEDIKRDIEKRDNQDKTRENSPLRRADDAILIDSSDIGIDETSEKILSIIRGE